MSFLVRLPETLYAADALAGINATEFSFGNARAAAWVAQLSYEDNHKKIQRIAKGWGAISCCRIETEFFSPLPVSSSQCVLIELPQLAILAFAGTDPLNLADWITDFDFRVDSQGLHSGFSRALEVIWKDVVARISAKDRPLLVAGHSLGGALAVLFASRLVQERREHLVGVYTFGMPRSGGQTFAQEVSRSIGRRTFRFIHGSDIVPAMPPSEFGFSHVGTRIQCERHGKFTAASVALQEDDEPQLRSMHLGALRALLQQFCTTGLRSPTIRIDPVGELSRFLPPPIADHLPDRYWQALSLTP
jgi:hypothetical protein